MGAGWTGGIVATELTKAGLNVLSLERGHCKVLKILILSMMSGDTGLIMV
ncbi:hypothetical protein oki169_08990 [Helicobacter pylori]